MTITIKEGSKIINCEFSEGKTILDVMNENSVQSVHAPCGGKGICKKCEVKILRHSGDDRSVSETVPACLTKAEDGMYVEVTSTKRVGFAGESFLASCEPDRAQEGFAAAVDIGTSAVKLKLISLSTAECVYTVSKVNVQRNWGTNVLSRYETAAAGYAQNLSKILQKQVSDMFFEACAKSKTKSTDVKYMAVSGNTMMQYFFAGINPAPAGPVPFDPKEHFGIEIEARSLAGFASSLYRGKIFIMPSVSAYIGGDSMAALLATGMCEREEPSLLLDLGSNAEMIIASKEKAVSCAADGGSTIKTSLMEHGMTATEGAICAVRFTEGRLEYDVLGDTAAIGLCGSGFIDVLAILINYGGINNRCHLLKSEKAPELLKPYIGSVNGKTAFFLTEDHGVYITDSDIAAFVMGKAALQAGIEICAEEYGVEIGNISKCYLSGGLGTFIKTENAVTVGLIPKELEDKCVPIGNASIGGAINAAISESSRIAVKKAASKTEYISLSAHPDFNDKYIDGMYYELD